jgi:hypothetical protein
VARTWGSSDPAYRNSLEPPLFAKGERGDFYNEIDRRQTLRLRG